MNDTLFALHVLPVDLQRLHKHDKDSTEILARAKAAVVDLAAKDGDEFMAAMPKVLVLLALLDHLNDRRASAMIPDYLDF